MARSVNSREKNHNADAEVPGHLGEAVAPPWLIRLLPLGRRFCCSEVDLGEAGGLMRRAFDPPWDLGFGDSK
jgi:hypothetical protein